MNSFHDVDAAAAPRRAARRSAEATLLLVDGVLDVPAALRLAATARRRAVDGGVRIDVRGAIVQDAALAALAGEVDGRVEIVGLSRHHERLLRYLEARPAVTRDDHETR